MEKDVFTQYDYEQIARLMAGEMDAEQELIFRKKLMTEPDKLKAFQELEEGWSNISNQEVFNDIDANSAWDKLEKRIIQKSSARKTKIMPTWIKWAAGWLIIFTLGVSIWYAAKYIPTEESLYTLVTFDEDYTHVHTLQDGSIVYLGNNTKFSYPEAFAPTQRFVKLQGEAFFDIAHNPNNPFLLETEEAIVEVLGTSFNIKTLNDNSMELFVETGKVKVKLKGKSQEPVVVEYGELLTVKAGQTTKVTAQGQYNTAWRKHHMHFKDEKLENIIKVLNQNYPVVFDIDEESLKERKLTVTFYNTSVNTMTELISRSLNIDFEQKNDSYIVFKSKD